VAGRRASGEDGDPERRSPGHREFIECKMKEERKAHVLIGQGYDSGIDGDAYSSIFFPERESLPCA